MTGFTVGLSAAEAARLREQYGPNDIPDEKKHPLRAFLACFWGPIPQMIEAAAIIPVAIAHWEDGSVILLLLLINAVVGYFKGRKAENEIELLKQRLAPGARVLRDGTWQDLPAKNLVPGDYIPIRPGNIP